MSFVHGSQVGGWGGPWLAIRKWQPMGPGRTKGISWWLIPEELEDDEEFKKQSHKGWQSLSPGGAFESDDLSVWKSISNVVKSTTVQTRNMKGDLQLGMGDMSDIEHVDDELYGPADVTHGGVFFDEEHARTLYSAWYEYMKSEGEPETDVSEAASGTESSEHHSESPTESGGTETSTVQPETEGEE
jgi:hypothetical protein